MNCKKRCCRIVSKHAAGTQDKVIHWTVLRIRSAARLKTHEEVDMDVTGEDVAHEVDSDVPLEYSVNQEDWRT